MTTHERWRSAPFTTLDALLGSEPVLIVAPHADDETIGCGGLIRQARRAGIPVATDILTDGSRSHPNSRTHPRERLAALRRDEALAALSKLGVDAGAVAFGGLEDSRLPREGAAAEDASARLRERIATTRADTVFVTWVDDPHCDHQAAFHIAVRAVLASAPRPRLYAYPVWSWTVPNLARSQWEGAAMRLDIAADLAAKREALACHASQLGQVIHDDPYAFALTEEHLALYLRPEETFLAVAL